MALYIGGVHPTLAGVAIALLIPVFTPERRQVEQAVELIRAFRQSPNSEYARAASRGLRESISINERLQTQFGPYVSFLVLPLFALVNAGVQADRGDDVGGDAVTADVGHRRRPRARQVHRHHRCDVAGCSGCGWGQLAPGLTLRRIAGGAALSGIGFTISLFIIDIAIHDPLHQDEARVGVLLASLLAFLLGWAIFAITDWISPPEPVGLKLVRPVDPDRDHIRGSPDAPLTLVEYGDFECPFCSRATGSIDQVREHFGDELRYVWRHLPLERVHPRAFDAARASEAAALQGRFWEMARELFAHPDDLEWSDIYRYAVTAGCDIERFDKDVRVHASKVLHRVQDDAQDAEVMDLNSTPTFFVNGKRHKGPWDAASLIRALQAARPVSWLTPQCHMDLRAEPGDADTGAAQHRLRAARRGDEADQLRDGGLAGRRRQCHRAPFAGCLRPGPLTWTTVRPRVLADRETDRQRDAADTLHLLERGGIALKDPLLRLRNRQIP